MEQALWWWSHWLLLIPVFFVVVMCVFCCRMLRRSHSGTQGEHRRSNSWPLGCCGFRHEPEKRGPGESPERILDRRYARGDITREQYELIRSDIVLQSNAASSRTDEEHR